MEKNSKSTRNASPNHDSLRFINVVNLNIIVVVDDISCGSNQDGGDG